MADTDELPKYSEVSHVHHNTADIVILACLPRREPINVPVSLLDSKLQLVKRIVSLTGLDKELDARIRHSDRELTTLSVNEAGIQDGDVLEVFLRNDDGTYEGPGATTATVKPWPDAEESVQQDDERQRSLFDGEMLPSYRMVTAQIQAARRERQRGYCSSACRITFLLLASFIWFSGLIAYMVVLPFFLITYGSRNGCEGDSRVSNWMVVHGISSLVLVFLSNKIEGDTRRARRAEAEEAQHNTCLHDFFKLLRTFLLVWFICGSVWTYRCHNDEQCSAQCSRSTLNLAFWYITSFYLFIATTLIMGPVFFCLLQSQANRNRAQLEAVDMEANPPTDDSTSEA